MIKVGISALALCVAASMSVASAADMPVKAPLAPAPVFSWSGFYIGGHFGWGTAHSDSTILESNNTFFSQGTILETKSDGPLLGGQIGVNYQMGQFLFGIEADGSWTNFGGDTRIPAVLLANRTARIDTQVNWLVTTTGRLGLVAGPALFYVKGGAAWAKFESSSDSLVTTTSQLLQTTSGNDTRFGWVIGGGLEYALGGSNWSVKAEYNYIDFGTDQLTRSGFNYVTRLDVSNERDVDSHMHVVKFGINYRFAPF
jgi:outer membrane immunogenic protein